MNLKIELEATSKGTTAVLGSFFQEEYEIARGIAPSLARSVQWLEEFSLRGGKYVRPFLVRLGFELAGGELGDYLKAGAAVELHHKHLLILDDIADRDESRYGGPSLERAYHQVFGTTSDGMHRSLSFAMLDGVFLGSLSRELLFSTSFSSEIKKHCLHILNTTMYRDTLAGWQIHGLQAIRPIEETTEDEFIQGLELVTARYTFEGPLQIGLILAKNQSEVLEDTLKTYSKYVGTAFQIQDDILGLFGDPKETGKPVGNDVREGKKTLLLQRAYKKAKHEDKKFLQKIVGSTLSESELYRVQTLVKESGSLGHSQALAEDYVQKGIQALKRLPSSPAKILLTEVAEYIISRNK